MSQVSNFTGTGLAFHYGRIGKRNGDSSDWDAPADSMYKDGDRSFFVENGLGNVIHAQSGKESIVISDNPGIFHFGDRRFIQAAFARSASELVFDDDRHLYLADIPRHKVGLITAGRRFVLVSSPFSKAENFTE